MQLTVVCFVTCTLLCFISATITEPPREATVLFGETARFNCTGEGYVLHWVYDGSTISEEIKLQRQISLVPNNVSNGLVSSSLFINATVDNDGAAIGCQVLTESFGFYDASASLHVIRIGPVRNLSVLIDNVPYIRVSWTIPSVIATDILVSNLRYTVTLGDNVVSDISDTHHQFDGTTVLHCTVYTTNVTAYDRTHHLYSSKAIMAREKAIDTCK